MKNDSFFQSFRHAIDGIGYTIRHERNFRIHMCIALFVIAFSFFYRFSLFEYFILYFAIISVFTVELVNTALERAVDLVTQEYHPLAKAVKDIMSGCVLFVAFCAFVVGIYLFMRPVVLLSIWKFFMHWPFLFLVVAIVLFLEFKFITLWRD